LKGHLRWAVGAYVFVRLFSVWLALPFFPGPWASVYFHAPYGSAVLPKLPQAADADER
jgi:hypothetical protein